MADSKFKILIVDDAAENRLLLTAALEDDYDLAEAASGAECMSQIETAQPDLILLDVTMPEMDGYEVCETLKGHAKHRNIPIIFVSARVSPEERLAGFEAGGDEYVTKPFNPEDLHLKISRALDDKVENLQLRKIVMEAMVSSSELGSLNRFLCDSSRAETYEALAEALFEITRTLGLNCVFQFRPTAQVLNFGMADDSLEARLLDKYSDADKFSDFQHRTVVNVPRLGILVKNMPMADESKYGRLKDHLAVLIDATDSKIEMLELALNMTEHRARLVSDLIAENDLQLAKIRVKIEKREKARREIMMGLLLSVEDQLFSLGLDEDQEKHLMHMLDSRVQEVDSLPDFSAEIESSFNSAKNRLRTLLEYDSTL
ncbi:MAG: PleD family two-component system response regulator [Pseudomonadales bacterium]